MDWNAEAKRVADYIQQQMPEAIRGAVTFGAADCAVLFGNESSLQNNGESSPLLQYLRANIPASYSEAGFSTPDAGSGGTWAIILRAHMGAANIQTLHRLVWESFGVLFPGYEREVLKNRDIKHPHIQPIRPSVASASRASTN
jgi:hypothetical protein